jgi:hypothetical protein
VLPLRFPEFGCSEELLQDLLPTETSTPIYELLGIVGSTDSKLLALRDRLAAAVTVYRQKCWSEAETGFQACFVLNPQDGPSGHDLAQLSPHLCSR